MKLQDLNTQEYMDSMHSFDCEQCRQDTQATLERIYMILCPDCGNKRCPQALNHRYKCTSSNAVNQKGELKEQSDIITAKLDPKKCRIVDPALAYDEPLNECELKSPVTQIPDDILTTTFAPLEQLIPDSIQKTLAERGQRYGEFSEHARITQNIKRAMADSPNWYGLADDQKEALEMLAHKIGRILNGDPDYHDSWHDIVGYTKLVADRLKGEQGE